MAEEEEDMFADLEKTMLECIDNMNNTRHSEINEPEIDVKCLEMVQDLSRIHGPAVRGYNLYKATKAFQEKRYLDSVYCETFALSLWIRMKYHANRVMEPEFKIPTEGNLADFLEEKKKEQTEFIAYIDRFMKNLLIDTPEPILKSIEFDNATELMNLCSELPKEWTVIQLCKQVNFDQFLQTRGEALRSPRLIFLTLFCYPMSERFNHQPIKIVLNQKNLNDLYGTCHDFSTRMDGNDYDYFRNYTPQQFETNIVDKMKTLLGPWIVLFSGKPKYESDKIYEKGIIARVDNFLKTSKHNYSQLQNVLICLIARRVYMLNEQHVKEGALYISKTKEQWFELMDFFYEKHDWKIGWEYYPVILVVDEQIDFFYWEMCNPKQEFTRVDSIVTLLKLYFHHQKNISNGYFNAKQVKGSAVLNPDRTLDNFNAHVEPFIKKLTNWTFLLDQEPTFNELRSMLAESDIYVYAGHGSGLQFISAYETCQLVTNAVVFLMGCSSVAFSACHGYAMGTGAHQYYHIAKSPAVIGHLNLAYLNNASLLLNVTLTQWLTIMHHIDPKWLRPSPENLGPSSENLQFENKLRKCLAATKPSLYLPKVIAECRTTDAIPIAFRAILCYRGLPVCQMSKT